MTHTYNFVGFELHNKRPDTRLSQSNAVRQGPSLRSLEHLGRSSVTRDRKYKVKCDGMTDPTTWTDKRNTRLEKKNRKSRFRCEN